MSETAVSGEEMSFSRKDGPLGEDPVPSAQNEEVITEDLSLI